jgi:hypothetical protein
MQVADAADTRLSPGQALERMYRLVNTSLALGMGYAELLAEDPLLPENLRPMAHAIVEHVVSVARLLQHFADSRSVEEVNDGLVALGEAATSAAKE